MPWRCAQSSFPAVADLADGEIVRLRMGEIEARNGGGWQHRVFGERHAGVRAASSKANSVAFSVWVGAGRITGRRADAAVFFGNQVRGGEPLVAGIAQYCLRTRSWPFGAGFGKLVGQRLQHDGVVIVVRRLEFGEFPSMPSPAVTKAPTQSGVPTGATQSASIRSACWRGLVLLAQKWSVVRVFDAIHRHIFPRHRRWRWPETGRTAFAVSHGLVNELDDLLQHRRP